MLGLRDFVLLFHALAAADVACGHRLDEGGNVGVGGASERDVVLKRDGDPVFLQLGHNKDRSVVKATHRSVSTPLLVIVSPTMTPTRAPATSDASLESLTNTTLALSTGSKRVVDGDKGKTNELALSTWTNDAMKADNETQELIDTKGLRDSVEEALGYKIEHWKAKTVAVMANRSGFPDGTNGTIYTYEIRIDTHPNSSTLPSELTIRLQQTEKSNSWGQLSPPKLVEIRTPPAAEVAAKAAEAEVLSSAASAITAVLKANPSALSTTPDKTLTATTTASSASASASFTSSETGQISTLTEDKVTSKRIVAAESLEAKRNKSTAGKSHAAGIGACVANILTAMVVVSNLCLGRFR